MNISVGSADIVEVTRQAAHVSGNRHAVVIENDDQVGCQMRNIIEGLIGKSACHRAVADHRHDRFMSAPQLPGAHHSHRRADRCGTVSRIKRIAVAFLALGKSAHPAVLTQMIKLFPSACQKLMCIRLMPHIPDDLVLRQIQCYMERHRQFNRSKIACQMPACKADFFDQELPDLVRQFFIGILRYFLYIIRFINTL